MQPYTTQSPPQFLRPIWLPDREIAQLLPHEDAYMAVRDCLLCHERGEFVQPLKPYVRPRGREGEYEGGRFIAMPAYLGGRFDMAGIKWIAGFPTNLNRGLPRASGTLQLNCSVTGRPLAIMECETLSARRTTAIAVLAVDLLAAPPPLKVAIIGAGPIGCTVLEALTSRARSTLADIRLCDTQLGRAEAAAEAITHCGLPSVGCYRSAAEAVRGANVVICATTGASGYLREDWLDPGWLVIALSLDDATPELFLSADRIIVDDFEQCCREEKLLHRLVQAGRLNRDRISAELGQVVAGVKPGRLHPSENIYLNPMGMAIEDIAVGVTAYRRSITLGIGQTLS